MPPRKERIPVVFDTNILIGYYARRSEESANSRLYRLWRNRRELQLIISPEVVAEYLEVLERIGIDERRLARLEERLKGRDTVTLVTPGPQPTQSRDPDDNVLLAAAVAGKAKFLLTNDRDLLDIPTAGRRPFRFQILTPRQFLAQVDS